ncbi:MAG: glycosyltransferase family 2 protein [Chloroflexi bacterium]|nr:glycosyltransferase family 2 protein [Chloroflexota bacterium]
MPSVDAVIPVYNEEHVLAQSVATLREFLKANMPFPWRIVIADNASTDRTLEVARRLETEYPEVQAIHLPQKGRGRALRKAWLESDADILSYMDVDLSTDLASYPPLIKAIAEEDYDISIGSRLKRGAHTTRSAKREFISRSYNLMIKLLFWHPFQDAQCGFKAISRRAAQTLLPLVEDQAWFFDTELLLLAHLRGYRIKEIPVTWIEDPDTRVHIIQTAKEDIKGLLRLRFHPPSS